MRLSASEVFEAVERHYGAGAVVVAEVPNATGGRVRSRIDALVLGCWPSRGLFVHGVEIKVSRSDLRRELLKPEKAESIARYCDAFFVAAPADLCDPDELPPRWGLLAVKGKKVKVVKKPPASRRKPTLDRPFLMAVIRACVAQKSEATKIAQLVDQAKRDAWGEANAHYEKERDTLYAENRRLSDELRQYRRFGGRAKPEEIGVLLRVIDNLAGRMGSLNRLRADARTIVDAADEIEKWTKANFEIQQGESA